MSKVDDAAWIVMDDPLPGDLASFPRGHERRNHMMFYPDECEPEPRAQRPPTTINRLPALDGKIVEVLGTLEPEHDEPRPGTPPDQDGFLGCPYCGFAQPSPFEKVGVYICGNCDRTVEVKE